MMIRILTNRFDRTLKSTMATVLTSLLFIFSTCSEDSNKIVDSIGIEEFSASKTTDADSLERNDQRQPFYVGVSYNGIPTLSGQYAVLSVGAIVTDQYAAPMLNTEVIFGIDRDGPFYIKKIANTGQIGWAMTKLYYPPSWAFESIRIISSAGNITDTSISFYLPIAGPQINLIADPETLWVYRPLTCDTSNISCQLTDWMGNPIDNGLIVFSALVAGELCGPSVQYTDANGIAETKYRIWYEEIPDGQTDPQSITVGVRASLFGYPDMEEEISIWCYRP